MCRIAHRPRTVEATISVGVQRSIWYSLCEASSENVVPPSGLYEAVSSVQVLSAHVDNLGAYSIPSGDRPSHPICLHQRSHQRS